MLKDEEIGNILMGIESVADLRPIIERLRLDCLLEPVYGQVRSLQANISLELLHSEKINNFKSRVKEPESLLFKMLYARYSNLNEVNDFLGFLILTEDTKECYEMLRYFLRNGFYVYGRIWDSLSEKNGYKSLDLNLRKRDAVFNLQIRTLNSESELAGGEFSHKSYKMNRILKLKKFMSEDPHWGLDFRINLIRKIQINFEEGGSSILRDKSLSFVGLLDRYSQNPLDYNSFFRKNNFRFRYGFNGIKLSLKNSQKVYK